jgi:outer membrane protein
VVQQYLEIIRFQSLSKVNDQNNKKLIKMLVLVRDLVKNGLKPEADTAYIRSEIIRNQIENRSYVGQIQRLKSKLAELVGQSAVEISDTAFLNNTPTISTDFTSISHPAEQTILRLADVENARLAVIQKSFLPKLTFFGNTFARGTGVDNGFFTGIGLQRWLQLKKSASFTTTSVEFINSDKITFERS